MQLALFLILIVILAVANARTIKNSRILIGKADGIFSKILNQNRKIWVYVPKSADDQIRRYPVVYVLDGDKYFSSVDGIVKQLSDETGGTSCPELIVVGIPHPNRLRDLTPTHDLFNAEGKKQNEYRSTGGGEAFTAFIEKELIPYVDSKYPTTSQRVLVGHSLGGLTVINIMLNHPDSFNDYVAIEPSMWWDDRKVLKQAREAFKQKRFDGKSLFLGIANTMPAGMNIDEVRKDTSAGTNHARSVLELADILKSNADNGLRFDYKYYEKENHASVPHIAVHDAFCSVSGSVIEWVE